MSVLVSRHLYSGHPLGKIEEQFGTVAARLWEAIGGQSVPDDEDALVLAIRTHATKVRLPGDLVEVDIGDGELYRVPKPVCDFMTTQRLDIGRLQKGGSDMNDRLVAVERERDTYRLLLDAMRNPK